MVQRASSVQQNKQLHQFQISAGRGTKSTPIKKVASPLGWYLGLVEYPKAHEGLAAPKFGNKAPPQSGDIGTFSFGQQRK